ncbi:hypothetical protein [Arthrobacter sp. HMWF013]|uniref:hypothetical protein n=1 Tax=Arthrobacter sp. HMWF013 TaxID=2056849 RepID=UPI0015E80A9F|nr:hypothetical protein [Arthrobacter sp. HMWF013]
MTDDVRIQGEVVGSDSYQVHAQLPEGTHRAVVTDTAVEHGTPLTNGTLLGAVSDRPIFVFSLEIPLFRDLKAKDKGSDVISLQKALGVSITGIVDWQTLEAVRSLYAKAEIIPPGGWWEGTYVRLSEFASLPPTDGTPVVRTIPAVGSLLEPDAPFAELSLGSSFVSLRASVRESDQITVGDGVSVQVPGGVMEPAVIAAVGEFQSQGTAAGRPPGKDIRIELPQETKLAAGQLVSVLFGSATEPVTAVPTLAIRSDVDGEYVLRRDAKEEKERIPIVVLRNANGWTALESDELSLGDEVLVSP